MRYDESIFLPKFLPGLAARSGSRDVGAINCS